jgi:hypothetical protein
MVTVRELARLVFPYGQREGWVCMAAITEQGYFDDSGTHATSEVVVVGGLIGRPDQWDQFEAAWAAKLANPLPEVG